MSGNDPAELLALALEVAREAGEGLLQRRRLGNLSWTSKSTPTDVVTEADTAAEDLIRGRLLGARPHDALLGEEGSDVAGTSGVRWVVDPLDGSVNYLYGLPGWAVSIAAEVDGSTVAGVVAVPTYGETFWAVRGSGAFRDGERVHVSTCETLDAALLGTGFAYDSRRRAVQARWVAAGASSGSGHPQARERCRGPVRDRLWSARRVRRAGARAVGPCSGRAHRQRGRRPGHRAAR